MDRLTSLALRCATLFGKSILVFLLARYLEPAQVGDLLRAFGVNGNLA